MKLVIVKNNLGRQIFYKNPNSPKNGVMVSQHILLSVQFFKYKNDMYFQVEKYKTEHLRKVIKINPLFFLRILFLCYKLIPDIVFKFVIDKPSSEFVNKSRPPFVPPDTTMLQLKLKKEKNSKKNFFFDEILEKKINKNLGSFS